MVMQLPDSFAEALGILAFAFNEVQPLLPTYAHLMLSALIPIFAGSYASLSRPPSAAKPSKKRRIKHGIEIEADDTESKMEGLSTLDAILFPIVAGCVLTGLYLIIKYLQDPRLLNTILNWYFGIFSVLAVSRMVCDGLDLVHSLAFPHAHISGGILYSVEARTQTAIPRNAVGAPPLKTPLPGPFSKLPLPRALVDFAWFLHILPSRKLTFKAYIRGVSDVRIKLGIHGIEGLVVGIASMAYFNLVAKPWWLTNLAGFAFAYGTLQIMSPTTFATGTLILVGLFFYDIYFVFFTPMMVTVATNLEIPAKLLFPRPSGDPLKSDLAMLGLGDVVLPGIMIGLALRFDLYMFYLRKQRTVSRAEYDATTKNRADGDDSSAVKGFEAKPAEAATSPLTEAASTPSEKSTEAAPASADHATKTANAASTVPAANEAPIVIKTPYVSPAEAWGDRIWTSPLLASPLPARPFPPYTPRNVFPKPYFTASLLGYTLGMLATLAAMHLSAHPQPALLYLVPAVLASLWLTALARRELLHLWHYSEAEPEPDEAPAADTASKTEPRVPGDRMWDYWFGPATDARAPGDDAPEPRALVSFEILAPLGRAAETSGPAPSYAVQGAEEHPGKRLRTG